MKKSRTDGARVGQVMRETVRAQVEGGDPPEAKATYERLQSLGLSEAQAVVHMAAVLAAEMFDMMKLQREYDRERYESTLRALPALPWDDEA